MSINKNDLNDTLRIAGQTNQNQNGNALNNAVVSVRNNQLANTRNVATSHGQVGTSNIVSLSSVDHAGQVATGTNLVQADDFSVKTSATSIQESTQVVAGGQLDDPSKANFDEAAWDVFSVEFWTDSTDLSALSASVNSIGGGVGDTIAGIMRLITALGALADLASNLNIGAATGKAGENAANAISAKATELGNNISNSVSDLGSGISGLGDIKSIQELGNQFDTIGAALDGFTGSILQVSEIISSPADVFVDTLAQETGVLDAFREVEAGVNDIEGGINSTLNAIGDTIDDVIGLADPIVETIAKAERLGANISKNAGILQNTVEIWNSNLGKEITQITGGAVLSKSQVGSVMDQINSGKPKDVATAVQTIVSNNQNIHPDIAPLVTEVTSFGNTKELQDNINNLAILRGVDPAIIADFNEIFVKTEDNVAIFDTTIQGNLFLSQNDFFLKNKNLKQYGSQYNNETGDGVPNFNTCDSYEELAQEVMVTKRAIDYVVVHSTNSYNNQFLTARDIHGRMLERGYSGMQYHYVIRRDGTLERGIPANVVTEVTPTDYANYSIDVVMVGGINAASGIENPDEYKGIESYTRAQFDTLESFLTNWYRRFPGLRVIGHNDVDDGSDDPSFDVKQYVSDRFDR